MTLIAPSGIRALVAIAMALLFTIPALAPGKSHSAAEPTAQAKAVIRQFVNAWNAHPIDELTYLFTRDGSFKNPAAKGEATVTGTYALSGIPTGFGFDVSREGAFDFRMTRR
ncbi:MAG TPA: hypothetical protein VKU62_04945, partial [Thermoanaerobaculia bacterium]|nr:hypothetical protein [Thermoanaerobaculia bacterium]